MNELVGKTVETHYTIVQSTPIDRGNHLVLIYGVSEHGRLTYTTAQVSGETLKMSIWFGARDALKEALEMFDKELDKAKQYM